MVTSSSSSVVFLGEEDDIRSFLGIKKDERVIKKVTNLVDITDRRKRALIEVLIDRWMLYKDEEDSIYVKHTASPRKNVLYQVILSGKKWDGIYEFAFKGKKISVKGYIIEEEGREEKILVIKSNGNYDLANLGDYKHPYTVCRSDFKSDEEFKKAMLGTGIVTQEELEVFYKPDPLVRPFLDKVLPRIILE